MSGSIRSRGSTVELLIGVKASWNGLRPNTHTYGAT